MEDAIYSSFCHIHLIASEWSTNCDIIEIVQ